MNSREQFIRWPGLGYWDLYFIFKFALLFTGYLNFHPLFNLALMAFLLLPISTSWLNRCRQLMAIPLAIALFYHDTWLPGIYSIMQQYSQVTEFSFVYLMELFQRFINLQMLLVAFVIFVFYLFIQQWLRVTTLVIGCMASILYSSLDWKNMSGVKPMSVANTQTEIKLATGTTSGGSLNDQINQFLTGFWQEESEKRSPLPFISSKALVPFDILFIQVCSFAWQDIKSVGLEKHPIWNRFDVLFTQFNSVASYSNPAVIRLLRGSCGQSKFTELFKPTATDCYLMKSISSLGYKPQWMMDHSGSFGNLINDLQSFGGLSEVPLMSQRKLPLQMRSFYGGEIFSDEKILQRWQRGLVQGQPTVTFFNTIVLHDGNRSIKDESLISYHDATNELLDTINHLFDSLNASGHKTMIVLLGEHGRNLTGDAIQMPGLRDIPSPDITQVPAAIKFTGLTTAENNIMAKKIHEPSSYYALTQLIANAININMFEQSQAQTPEQKLGLIVKQLPRTAMVSENQGAMVLEFNHNPYIKLQNDFDWMHLPTKSR